MANTPNTPIRTSWLFKSFALLFLLLQAGVLALSLSTHSGNGSSGKTQSLQKKGVPVDVLTLAPRRVVDTVEIPARIEAWNSVDLCAEVDGQVIETCAKKGDKLAKGDIILRIDDRVYAARVLKAEADLGKTSSEFARTKKLFDTKTLSEREFDSAKNAKSLAESEVLISRTAVDKCVIRSPINGYLDTLPVDLGEYVCVGKPVANIQEVDRVKLIVGVPENVIRSVSVGMELDFSVAETRHFKGTGVFLATAGDETSLSFKAEIEVRNDDLYFRPGMIVKTRVTRRVLEDAIVVPLGAVIPKYGAYYVYLADKDNAAELREISVGLIAGCEAVVTNGLKAGDRVVIEGHTMLRGKEPLLIMNTAESGT